ncbi:hypothetical protein Pla175_04800 [Pirellulimonas nuda]|uniref:Dockerin domain-containing protein n=1 Tax=Pirellulimonas nuda TaxID=2528009 RepID=A0A518D6L3_9BACT|nr:hypothetical protein [Pirellulimonas nuda]QDU87124.1 hypothetical protein Pla175_04800 [Pirellulimonas nuda]
MKTLSIAGAKRRFFRCPAGRSALLTLLAAGSLLLVSGQSARAIQVDLSLNLLYEVPTNPNSAGAWQLVAKSDGSGIAALRVLLNDNAVSPGLMAPMGTVNSSNPAGFSQRYIIDRGSYSELFIAQPATPTTPETGVFYGFGTLQNGAPNFPGKPGGSNSIGPSLTTLTGVPGLPWAPGDVLGEAAWNTAAIVATGTFAAGQLPDFFSSGSETHIASTYTSIGTLTTIGATSMPSATTITTIVRDNLMGLAGDFNLDGAVNAADYTVWRDTLTLTVPNGTGADGSGNGVIDQADYDIWKMNFGAPAMMGPAVGANSVPEASSLLLLLAAAAPLGIAKYSGKTRLSARNGKKPQSR